MRYITVASALLLSVAMFLSGCSATSLMKKMEPTGDVNAAKQDVDLLRSKNFEALEKLCSPGVLDGHTDETFAAMSDEFPEGQPISITTVGFNTFKTPDTYKSSITLQYQFPSAFVFVEVKTREADDKTWIEGFHVQQSQYSLQEINRFTFRNKGMSQFVILFLAVASFSICTYAFVVCVKTRIAKRKWLWLIAVWVGLGCVYVNWTTGEADYRVININLPAASAVSTPYGPWIIGAFFPLGAILFLWRKDSLAMAALNSAPTAVESQMPQVPPENLEAPPTG